ncbi:FMRFamide neuropeptides-like [Palaemon carinicauda]|uniref:FMRFamide neuropeptides-like n=1 Tax=Palaemon carinicauda TaxID=392227 RepID=UPI0035B60AA1
MILTCWILVALVSCFSQALKPLVSVVLEPNNSNASHEDDLALPQKRLNQNRYFLRFGRGSSGKYYDENEPASLIANDDQQHFLREVRNLNFLRFGRSGGSELALEDRRSPFEDPSGPQENEQFVEKEGDGNMVRSARGNRNFLRFGRGSSGKYYDENEPASLIASDDQQHFLREVRNLNFLRFGRSGGSELALEDRRSPFEVPSGPQENEQFVEKEEGDGSMVRSARGNRNFLRFGRGSSGKYYDENEPASLVASDNQQHFLREVRNLNFLRFGRSGGSELALEDRRSPFEDPSGPQENEQFVEKEGGDGNMVRSARGNRNFLRFGRQYNKNFLRFGRSADGGIEV